ncbi:uncharacterized protein LOC134193109 [Corticium candelabrum]|uniref:uncharacterized protein LOC134193109 n=1 Tax=Corticium candelabrum TaxID=121492 RepID=UPI002E258A51|nr:uncharacterized protein LOC134193109 [Corticium candelabrum]
MESNAYPAEKSGYDQPPPSYYPSHDQQPPPPNPYTAQPQPMMYPQQPQPMMYQQQPQPMMGYTQQTVYGAPLVKDYMVLSLITLVCCCWPIGICALLSSMRVRESLRINDRAGAEEASRTARTLNIVGIVIGSLIVVGVIVAVVVTRVTLCSDHDRHYGRC